MFHFIIFLINSKEDFIRLHFVVGYLLKHIDIGIGSKSSASFGLYSVVFLSSDVFGGKRHFPMVTVDEF